MKTIPQKFFYWKKSNTDYDIYKLEKKYTLSVSDFIIVWLELSFNSIEDEPLRTRDLLKSWLSWSTLKEKSSGLWTSLSRSSPQQSFAASACSRYWVVSWGFEPIPEIKDVSNGFYKFPQFIWKECGFAVNWFIR